MRRYLGYFRQRRFVLMALAYAFMNVLANVGSFTAIWIADVVPFANSSMEESKDAVASVARCCFRCDHTRAD